MHCVETFSLLVQTAHAAALLTTHLVVLEKRAQVVQVRRLPLVLDVVSHLEGRRGQVSNGSVPPTSNNCGFLDLAVAARLHRTDANEQRHNNTSRCSNGEQQ